MGIPMHEDDILLIGASHEENPDCNYIVADFALDKRGNLQPLEIRSEEWKNDNRILNVGVCRTYNGLEGGLISRNYVKS